MAEPRGLRGRRRWGAGAFASLALLYLAIQVVLPAVHLTSTPGDFGNYYRAGAALLAGESPFGVAKFNYPPLLAFLVAPLALLPLATARWVWFLLSQLCLLGAAWLTWDWLVGEGRTREGGGPEAERGTAKSAAGVVLAVWALAGTVPENLVLGQINPLLLLLLAGALRAWHRQTNHGPARAGALIGIAAALKLWPGALALGFLLTPAKQGFRGRLRAISAVALTSAALLLGPWLVLQVTVPSPHLPTTAGYWRGTPAPLNVGLPAVALRLADAPDDRGSLPESWVLGHDVEALRLSAAEGAISVAVAVAVLLAGLVAIRRFGGRPDTPSHLAPAALLSLCLLASPLSWYHYQLLHLPVLAWLAHRWWRRRRRLALVGLALLGTGLTRGQNLFGLYVDAFGWTAGSPALLWTVTSLVPVLNLGLFVLLLGESRLPPTDPAAEPETA